MTTYSSRQAARIVGITYRQIDYWDRIGIIGPSDQPATGSGSRRRYTYDDLLRLRTARSLSEDSTLRGTRDVLASIDTFISGSHVLVGDDLRWQLVTPEELIAVISEHRSASVLRILPLASIKSDVDDGITAAHLGDLLAVS